MRACPKVLPVDVEHPQGVEPCPTRWKRVVSAEYTSDASGAPPGRRSRCLVLGKDALCQRELAVQVAQRLGIEPSPRGLEPRWPPWPALREVEGPPVTRPKRPSTRYTDETTPLWSRFAPFLTDSLHSRAKSGLQGGVFGRSGTSERPLRSLGEVAARQCAPAQRHEGSTRHLIGPVGGHSPVWPPLRGQIGPPGAAEVACESLLARARVYLL